MTHDLRPPARQTHFAVVCRDQYGGFYSDIYGRGISPDDAWNDARQWVDQEERAWFDKNAGPEGSPFTCLEVDEGVVRLLDEGAEVQFEVRGGRIHALDDLA